MKADMKKSTSLLFQISSLIGLITIGACNQFNSPAEVETTLMFTKSELESLAHGRAVVGICSEH